MEDTREEHEAERETVGGIHQTGGCGPSSTQTVHGSPDTGSRQIGKTQDGHVEKGRTVPFHYAVVNGWHQGVRVDRQPTRDLLRLWGYAVAPMKIGICGGHCDEKYDTPISANGLNSYYKIFVSGWLSYEGSETRNPAKI